MKSQGEYLTEFLKIAFCAYLMFDKIYEYEQKIYPDNCYIVNDLHLIEYIAH